MKEHRVYSFVDKKTYKFMEKECVKEGISKASFIRKLILKEMSCQRKPQNKKKK